MANSISSISALNSIQWTELNGSNLSATEKTNTTTLINNIKTDVAGMQAILNPLWQQMSQGGVPISQQFSLDDLQTWLKWQPAANYINTMNAVKNGMYPLFNSRSEAMETLSSSSYSSGAAILAFDETTNKMSWFVRSANSSTITTLPADTDVEALKAQFGANVFASGNYPLNFNNPTAILNFFASNPIGRQVATNFLGNNWSWQTLANSLSSIKMPIAPIPTFGNVTIPATLIATIQQQLNPNFSSATKMSIHDWYAALSKLTQSSFREASKLSVKDGGGLKTYGNKWYANGEEINYMEMVFAVRVNQLFVINTTITDNLQLVQENNKRIKFANQISSIVSTLSPTNSTGTISAQWLAINVLDAALKTGQVSPDSFALSGTTAQMSSLVGTDYGNFILFKDSENGNKLTWFTRLNASTNQKILYDPANPILGIKGKINAVTNTKIDTFGMSTTRIMMPDISGLKTVMPSSLAKLFTTTGSYSYFIGLTNTLNQTDCNSIVTELKSYTSGVDSDNQLIQTNLSQYNDKRSEVLDQITSVVKGNAGILGSMARNLGYS
jgi:hypothetical protein